MTFSIIFLFVSASIFWITPETDVLKAEIAPFLADGEELSETPMLGAARFEDVIGILRRSSAPIQRYLDQCDALAWKELPFAQPVVLPQMPLDIHVGEGQTNYLVGTLKHYLARRLVQARLFDEAKKVLEDLTPENSIDPAGVLILKAVVFHHFSEREEGLAALKDFREVADRESVSRRSTELAKLLQFEWERQSQEEDTERI